MRDIKDFDPNFAKPKFARVAQLVEHATDTGGVPSSNLGARTKKTDISYNITMKTTPKDFFLHLGAVVALYITATALISLSFSIINYYFPDVLAGYFYGNSVAWPISMLIVLVPALYIIEWLINRDILRMPEKKDLWIRKWRVYLIIFSAIVLIGGDLITLINTYLNGEITSRFVYKIIVILLVGGVVGKYYFFSLYSEMKWSKFVTKVNPVFGIVLTAAAVVMGFVAVGSPATQRAYRLDSQRINDLTTIQYQIINYWQQKAKLPLALADLNDSISGFTIPTDPETKAEYSYTSKGVTSTKDAPNGISFELCATFSRATQDGKGRGDYYGGSIGVSYPVYDSSYPIIGGGDNWKHEAGQSCFLRTIDPDKYSTDRPMLKGI